MKQKFLLITLITLMSMAGLKGYSFAAKNSDGVTIYYNLIDNNTAAEVTYTDRAYWNGINVISNEYTGVVNIPSTVSYNNSTLPVTRIGNHAFGCSSVTSVTIPESVTSIGGYAFYRCYYLTSVTIPSSVTSIGDYAFSDCSDAFVDGMGLFSDISGLTSVNIGEGVTSIGDYAFSDCWSLTSVNIPEGVTSIGDYAFSDCSGLTNVDIPSSVTSIGDGAFWNCSGLTSVTIPSSVTSIGIGAFRNCSSLTSVTIPEGVTSIGYGVFYNCSSLTSVTIPESVTSIGDGAFYECTSLTSVTIPESVTSIGDGAFYECTSLTSVTINSNDIMSETIIIRTDDFGNISERRGLGPVFGTQVETYIIGNGVTNVGEYAFYNCTGLTSVTIPEGVTSIGNYAFSYCSGLTSVTIPSSVTSIGKQSFYRCTGLTKVIVPDIAAWCSISFEDYYYANPLYYAKHLYSDFNTEITDLVIPSSVTSIGNSVFHNCTGLTSVTIPEGVTSIGNYAFYSCDNIQNIYCYAISCPGVSYVTFSSYSPTLHVPEVSLQQYKGHSVWGKFFEIVPLDESNAINEIGIEGAASEIEAIYDRNGQRLAALRRGINIIKMSDGTIKKVMVK